MKPSKNRIVGNTVRLSTARKLAFKGFLCGDNERIFMCECGEALPMQNERKRHPSFERPSSTKDPTNEFEWSQATIEAATMQLRDVTVRSYRGWREEDGLSRV